MRAHALTGRFVHGTGGSGVFVDGQRIRQTATGEAGYGCWLGARVLYQFRDTTLWSCLADGSDARQEQAQGAAWLAAGGDLWIAHQPPRGVLTSWGHFIPGAGALGVAKDGSAVFVIVDFSGDRGIARYRPGATAPDLVLGDVRGPFLLTPYAQFDALDADRFMWRTIDGVLHTHSLPEPVRQPWPSYQPSLIDAGDQGVWVVDGDGDDRLRARPLDSLTGYIVREQGAADQARGFSICGRRDDGVLRLGWSTTTGEDAASFRTVAIDLASPRVVLGATPIPVLPIPPSPAQPFGPLSAPLPEGTSIDVAAYVIGAPATWPRLGTHPMHQVIDGARVHFVKFGDRHAYETWSLDKDWVHHLEDASNPETQVFTDTRWLPRSMRVGQAHAFSTGEHEAIWMRRAGCQEIRRGPFTRRMWVVDAWARFWCGPDLGERAVVCVAYDSTGGFHADDRGVELYYFAAGAGWIRWEYHASSRVFAGDTPRFDDATRTARSDFYRLGGAAVAPTITTCAIAPTSGPVVPPMETHVTLHADVIALFRRFLTVFPVPNGAADSEEFFVVMRAWMERWCQQVKHHFPYGMPGVGGEFGWKRASNGRPLSKESLALIVRDAAGATVALHGWDLFTGVGTGNPTPNFSPGHHDLWNPPDGPQVFVPVDPIDHLASPVPVTPPTPGRARLSGRWVACSAFNLLERTPEEQAAWLTDHRDAGVQIHRIMVARTPLPSPEVGLAALPRGLAALKAHRQRGHITINCDTKLYNRTKDEVRAFTRAVAAELDQYDTSVVASVQLFNEPVHATQQGFCADPAFNRELEAMIPLKFPCSWGPTTHSGLVGGSFGTIHGDRGLSPEENAQHAADLQRIYGREFFDDESLGTHEVDQPGRRTADPAFPERLARAALANDLLGATWHSEAGLTAHVSALGPIHREARRRFVAALGAAVPGPVVLPPPPPPGEAVTPEQIAQVFAGGFFEQVSTLLRLTGTVEARRDQVHAWMLARVATIAGAYLTIFKRACDLEGYGSRLRLFVEHGWTDAQLLRELQAAYDRGDR